MVAVTVSDKRAFMPSQIFCEKNKSDWHQDRLCRGDCGACTVIQGNLTSDGLDVEFKPFNSCITPVYLLDGSHVVTVDALDTQGELDSVQSAFVGCHASQCGLHTLIHHVYNKWWNVKSTHKKTFKLSDGESLSMYRIRCHHWCWSVDWPDGLCSFKGEVSYGDHFCGLATDSSTIAHIEWWSASVLRPNFPDCIAFDPTGEAPTHRRVYWFGGANQQG